MRIDVTSFLLAGRLGLRVGAGTSRATAVTHIFRISLRQDHRGVRPHPSQDRRGRGSRRCVRDAVAPVAASPDQNPTASRLRASTKLHDGMEPDRDPSAAVPCDRSESKMAGHHARPHWPAASRSGEKWLG